ncbi:MAG: hypothetical protein ABS41_00800 [Arenimonas sp. SCN 70-307]|uniref:hypothetical protein n=1 Tax=Arenimonas sp. SCN 70-307 TaxID=1660089 RepID=UPI00086AFCD4|nr:hypothetical protein [Arenimonas sp. SCN 70-307]ODS64974.1 MAG: hypothetical protein ABS41_00800 [Arenimonas sp. SCN 70-307]
MEFKVELGGRVADLGAVREALCAVDPAALADLDPLNPVLRVSANLSSGELRALLARGGIDVATAAIRPLPSNCCGGCGG